MSIQKRWLSTALAIQVIFAAAMMWRVESLLTKTEPEAFFSANLDSLNRIVIDDGESDIALIRVDEQWRLSSETGLPADSLKVNRMLDELAELKPGIPVVTRASNHARFEVASDDYYRKVQLFDDEAELGTLYVGTTPAMRQSHVRTIGDDNVYALKLNRFELSTSSNGWLNKSLLRAKGITNIEHENWTAERKGEGWVLTRSDGELLDDANNIKRVGDLVRSLENMRVISELTEVNKQELEPLEVYSVVGNETYEYQFYEQDGDKLVSRNDLTSVFKISNAEYNSLASLDFSDTQMAESEDSDTPEDAGNSTDS